MNQLNLILSGRKMKTLLTLLFFFSLLLGSVQGQEREWSDASGKFSLTATLMTRNETSVVLEKSDKSLVIVELDQLSRADRDYIQSLDESEAGRDRPSNDEFQNWTFENGDSVTARVIRYGRRELKIHRHYGKVYVGDRAMKNLDEPYKSMIPAIVAHQQGVDVENEADLLKWLARRPKSTYDCTLEGVMLELEDGDMHGVPFFLFSDEDQKVLKPGWENWIAAEKAKEEQEESRRRQTAANLQLRAKALAKKRNEQIERNISRLHLQLEAVNAGLVDLWEVTMIPPGNRRLPVRTIVTGRNSREAQAAAQRQYPNYRVAGIAKQR